MRLITLILLTQILCLIGCADRPKPQTLSDQPTEKPFSQDTYSIALQKKAESGDAEAQYNLGRCYYGGLGTPKDYKEAVKWISSSAAQGNADAQYELGSFYSEGLSVPKNKNQEGYSEGVAIPKDEKQAGTWYLKAGIHGHALAQYKLGLCFMNGIIFERDQKTAVIWFKKAADQGNAKAACALACCYFSGTGVAKDENEAEKWFSLAANEGDLDALKALAEIQNARK